MKTRICVAGVTGWTGSAVASAVIASEDFELAAGIARKRAGEDLGTVLGGSPLGVPLSPDLATALKTPFEVLIDFTAPDSVKDRVLSTLAAGRHVVIGTSGLTAVDYSDLEAAAIAHGVGIIAAGNFSITAALAKHFALIAARFLPEASRPCFGGATHFWRCIAVHGPAVDRTVCPDCKRIFDRVNLAPTGKPLPG